MIDRSIEEEEKEERGRRVCFATLLGVSAKQETRGFHRGDNERVVRTSCQQGID